MQLKFIQLRSKRLKFVEKPPRSTTMHCISNSRSNRNCIACMKWCKRLLFLTSCLHFLTHSGNENMYQSYLYPSAVNMNHQTVYTGKCHYHGSSIQESSSQKVGSSKSWQACGHTGLVPIFLGNYVAKINTIISLDPILLGHQLQGFLPKLMS